VRARFPGAAQVRLRGDGSLPFLLPLGRLEAADSEPVVLASCGVWRDLRRADCFCLLRVFNLLRGSEHERCEYLSTEREVLSGVGSP